jgi:hypothetical protein
MCALCVGPEEDGVFSTHDTAHSAAMWCIPEVVCWVVPLEMLNMDLCGLCLHRQGYFWGLGVTGQILLLPMIGSVNKLVFFFSFFFLQ